MQAKLFQSTNHDAAALAENVENKTADYKPPHDEDIQRNFRRCYPKQFFVQRLSRHFSSKVNTPNKTLLLQQRLSKVKSSSIFLSDCRDAVSSEKMIFALVRQF